MTHHEASPIQQLLNQTADSVDKRLFQILQGAQDKRDDAARGALAYADSLAKEGTGEDPKSQSGRDTRVQQGT